MTQAANSALQGARLRFVEGLPARAEELSITAERLGRDPGDQEAAAMLRRRLHALLASAQVFEERALSLAVQDLIARLDVAQRAERAFTREEIDAVGLVVASIPTYVRPSLQPPAAYSDVRELLGGVHERPTIRPAAVSGESWHPPAQDRVESGSWGVEAAEQGLGPVLLAEAESGSESGLNPETDRGAQARERSLEEFVQGPDPDLDHDEYLPASLADSSPPVANDLGSGAEGFERPLPPKARRIIALSALQPGNAPLSEPTPEPPALEVAKAQPSALAALDTIQPVSADTRQAGWAERMQPISGRDSQTVIEVAARQSVEVPSVRPLPSPRDSTAGEIGGASAQLFADALSELQAEVGVDTVSEIVRTLATPVTDTAPEPGNDSWSQAVAAVSEELAAWRDSLQPDPIANIDIEDESSAHVGTDAERHESSATPAESALDSSPGTSALQAQTDTAITDLDESVESGEIDADYIELAAPDDEDAELAASARDAIVLDSSDLGDPVTSHEESDEEFESLATTRVTIALTNIDGMTVPAYAPEPARSTVGLADRVVPAVRSFMDVIAEAGRAGLSGGAAALESVDVGAPSLLESLEPHAVALEATLAPEWLESNRVESGAAAPVAPELARTPTDSESTSMKVTRVTRAGAGTTRVVRGAVIDASPKSNEESSRSDLLDSNRVEASEAIRAAPSLARTPTGPEPTRLEMAGAVSGETRSAASPETRTAEHADLRGREDVEMITLDMRPPDVTEWTERRTESQARSEAALQSDSSPRTAAPAADAGEVSADAENALEPVSRILPITASEQPDTDADADSSATIGALEARASSEVPWALQLTAAGTRLEPDADADSSATAASPTYDGQLYLPLTAAAAADPAAHAVDSEFSDETSPGLGPPVVLKQPVSGLLPTPRPVLLLLVSEAACAARVRASLTESQFTILHAASADAAVRSLHDAKPDLALVAADLVSQPEVDLVRRLKSDPLAPVQHVQVLLAEGASCDQTFLDQAGADGALHEPLTAAALEPLLRGSLQLPAEAPAAREGSIDEIAAQIAEEIRRGIAESLRTGKHEHVRVGDGSQLMAAAWSAIGRVRSHLADSERGRADEDDAQTSPRHRVSETSSEAGRIPSVHPSQLLAGCRVLVADDDPAVLWFFVGLLREASAHVLQAHNGREALELARRKQPHVIVSDILMPKLDGFGLCRELKRDALLSHVPVILLSWKDDLLQRMRELDAGAAGYLRKEAGSQQILAQLTEVLQPRTRLVAKLRGHGEVMGSLADLGALSMLELVATERPDARIGVRDAWNLFEVDIRAGRRLSVTRTAADGAFTRGEKALMQLLGLAGGEFQVSSSAAPLKAPIPEPLDRALAAAGRRLSALLDAVSDARLLRVCLIAFDGDVLQSLLSAPSTRLHEVVALFRTGLATAEGVLREGRFAPGELEDYLRELARCVAITGVWDASGEDLVAAAQRERETPQLALLSSTLPPRTGSGSWSLVPEVRRRAKQSDPPASEAQPTAAAADAVPDVAPRAADAPAPVRRSSVPPPIIASSKVAASSIDADADDRVSSEAESVAEAPPPLAAEANGHTNPGLGLASQPPELPDWLKPASTTSATASTSTNLATIVAGPARVTAWPAALEETETDAISKAELESFDLPIPSMFACALPARADGLRLAGTLLVLAGVGYFGWQQFILPPEQAPTEQTRVEAAKSPPPATTPEQPAVAAPVPQPAQPTIQNTQFGKVLPFVDASRGVAVASDQGLLVVEFQGGSEPAPNIRIGARELGKAPLALALPAGRHELVVRSAKSTSFRYLIVRAGETRIVSVPLAEL